MCETFTFDVDFGTKFEQLGTLRDRMLDFVKLHNRDYLPVFDVVVIGSLCTFVWAADYIHWFLDIPEQSKMTLSADIKYKGNWQHSSLKSTYYLI